MLAPVSLAPGAREGCESERVGESRQPSRGPSPPQERLRVPWSPPPLGSDGIGAWCAWRSVCSGWGLLAVFRAPAELFAGSVHAETAAVPEDLVRGSAWVGVGFARCPDVALFERLGGVSAPRCPPPGSLAVRIGEEEAQGGEGLHPRALESVAIGTAVPDTLLLLMNLARAVSDRGYLLLCSPPPPPALLLLLLFLDPLPPTPLSPCPFPWSPLPSFPSLPLFEFLITLLIVSPRVAS